MSLYYNYCAKVGVCPRLTGNGFGLNVGRLLKIPVSITSKLYMKIQMFFAKPKKKSAKQAINLRFALRCPPPYVLARVSGSFLGLVIVSDCHAMLYKWSSCPFFMSVFNLPLFAMPLICPRRFLNALVCSLLPLTLKCFSAIG